MSFQTAYNRLMTPERQLSSAISCRGSTLTFLSYKRPDCNQMAALESKNTHSSEDGARRATQIIYGVGFAVKNVLLISVAPLWKELFESCPSASQFLLVQWTFLMSIPQPSDLQLRPRMSFTRNSKYHPTDSNYGTIIFTCWYQRPSWSWPRILAQQHWPLWCRQT